MKIEVGQLTIQFKRERQGLGEHAYVCITSTDYFDKGVSITEAEWPFLRASIDEIFRREQQRRDQCRPE